MSDQTIPTTELIKGVILLLIFIIQNIILYTCKYILRKNDYFASWHVGSFGDIKKMYKLAKKTDDPFMRFVYYLLPSLVLLLIPVLFLVAYFLTTL